MIESHIIVQKTAKYYLSKPLDSTYKNVCFVLHGYGQLIEYFSRHFRDSFFEETLFVFPEGLNKFYLKNSQGRVGASWMTKEDRLCEIEDYIFYLDKLYTELKNSGLKNVKTGVLGFSQGVATACRWVAESKYNFEYLINWAGAFPPDLKFDKVLKKYPLKDIWMVLGDQDEFLTKSQFEEHLDLLKTKNIEAKALYFNGTHQIHQDTLKQLFNKLLN